MKINKCRFPKEVQNRILEYFILEATARAAANLLDIQSNSVTLFYTKISQMFLYQLALEVHEVFHRKIEFDESYFWGEKKAREDKDAFAKVTVFGILK